MFNDDTEYELSRGSDIVRDGMFLKLTVAILQLAEIFYLDVTHRFTLTCYEPSIPLTVTETLIE